MGASSQPEKPTRLCDPSHIGLLPEWPQRHRNWRSPVASSLPSSATTRTWPITTSGPLSRTVTVTSVAPVSTAEVEPGPSGPPSVRV